MELLKKLLNEIDILLNDWEIIEEEITPEMYLPENKEKLKRIEKNKLRKVWFASILNIIITLNILFKDNAFIENLKGEVSDLCDKVRPIKKTSEKLVKTGDNLLKEIKTGIQQILEALGMLNEKNVD